jgi:hypothetical protein
MQLRRIIGKGVAMIFCWDGPDFKPQTDDTSILQMYLVFNVFYFYSGVDQKNSGVGRAHLPPPPFATPLIIGYLQKLLTLLKELEYLLRLL